MRGVVHPRSFATFAAGSPLAPMLRNVWIGTPDRGSMGDAGVVHRRVSELADQRDRLLDAMALRYAGDAALHARALLSQWSKFYFRLAAPAAIAAALTLRRPLAMNARRCTVALRDGMPEALYLPADALGAIADEPAHRYVSFMREHAAAVIDSLSALARISPRVLWNNLGNLLDALFEAHREDGASEIAACDAAWLFASPSLFDGEPNPVLHALRLMAPRSSLLPVPFRARRVCCLRYEIPGERRLCASCPLLLTMNDEQIAEQRAPD